MLDCAGAGVHVGRSHLGNQRLVPRAALLCSFLQEINFFSFTWSLILHVSHSFLYVYCYCCQAVVEMTSSDFVTEGRSASLGLRLTENLKPMQSRIAK